MNKTSNTVWNRWSRAIVVVMLLVTAVGVFGAEVTVTCADPALVTGQSLHISRAVTYYKWPNTMRPEVKSGRFNNGKCNVSLEKGTYRFSVLYSGRENLVALQSPLVRINGDMTVTLQSMPARKVTVSHKGKNIPINFFSIRLENSTKDASWGGSGEPSAILSPNQKYFAKIKSKVGGSRFDSHFLMWPKLDSRSTALRTSSMGVTACSFQWGEPHKVKNPDIEFTFPHDKLKVTSTKPFVLYTNRRVFEFRYSYDHSAKRIHMQLRPFEMGSATLKHTLGGPYVATAWATWVPEWKGKPYHCVSGADLHNKSGDTIQLEKVGGKMPKTESISWQKEAVYSRAGFKTSLSADWSKYGNAGKDAWKKHGEPGKHFKIKVSYNIDKPTTAVLVPKPFMLWKSKRFSIRAPAHWEWRSRSYLDRAERVRETNFRSNDMRPKDFHRVVDWFTSWGNAYASKGGDAMYMTFAGIFIDPADMWRRYPPMFLHENLHNFGYSHGGGMDRAEKLGNKLYKDWKLVYEDHPERPLAPARPGPAR